MLAALLCPGTASGQTPAEALAPLDRAMALAETSLRTDELQMAESRHRAAIFDGWMLAGHPTANLVAGMVLMKRGQYAEARDALNRAAAADPESPKVYYQLSLAHARLGDSDQASRSQEIYLQKLRAMEARIEDIRRAGAPSGGVPHP